MTAQDLLGLRPGEVDALLSSLGAEPYRANQLLQAIYRDGASSLAAVATLPRSLRATLAAAGWEIGTPAAVRTVSNAGGDTTKALLRFDDGTLIETVLMQYERRAGRARNTVCVSTQAGCAMGCTFCATGQMGFERNLSAAEVVQQVMHFARLLQAQDDHITNLVFMGMGEPLANYAGTLQAVRILSDPRAFGLGQRHITISTVGIVRAIDRLAAERLQVNLAISLHAPNDALRCQLVPTAGPTSVADLVAAAKRYFRATGRRVTYEYALIAGVNDSSEVAGELGRLLGPVGAHLNVIPLNPTAGIFRRPARASVREFRRTLLAAGVNCTVRIEKGSEISAACGQLRTGERVPMAP